MDEDAIASFVAVAEAGSFSVAAAQLSCPQPTLSRRVARLERALGVPLLVRGPRGVEPTVEGRDLVTPMRRWLQDGKLLRRRSRELVLGVQRSVVVGFGLSSLAEAPRVVSRFRARHPGVEVSLEDLPAAVQVDQLLAGTLDVGFVRAAAHQGSGLAHRRVGHDRLAVARPAGRTDVPDPFAEPLERPLIALHRHRGPGLAAQIDRWTQSSGRELSIGHRAGDLLTVLALVAGGVGAAIVPLSARRIAPAGVDLEPLPEPDASWSVDLAWRTPILSGLVSEFIDLAAGDPAAEDSVADRGPTVVE